MRVVNSFVGIFLIVGITAALCGLDTQAAIGLSIAAGGLVSIGVALFAPRDAGRGYFHK